MSATLTAPTPSIILPPTRVIKIGQGDFDLYVGRRNAWKGLEQSCWANPFHIGRRKGMHTREQALVLYSGWLDEHPELLARIPELRGLVLACWCRPDEGFGGLLLCHAQILAGRADGIAPELVP